jgi:hypothetical protein
MNTTSAPRARSCAHELPGARDREQFVGGAAVDVHRSGRHAPEPIGLMWWAKRKNASEVSEPGHASNCSSFA